tara:strand:- start:2761 stop:3129 length:369 start_codon:yes stop_codon:yes gene_type:complete
MANIFIIGLGGFMGANLRYFSGLLMNKYYHEMFGTLVVNIIGSFLIALFYGYLNDKNVMSEELRLLIPIGILGSFTTFSTFSYTTLILFQDGNIIRGMLNIVLSITFCLIFAYLGFITSKIF